MNFISSLKKTEEEGTLPNSGHEASVTLKPNPDRDITRKPRPISFLQIQVQKSQQDTSQPN